MTTIKPARAIKAAHRRRARIAPEANHHSIRGGFKTIRTADATNRSLEAFAEQNGKAHLLFNDGPWQVGRAGDTRRGLAPEEHYPTMSAKALLDLDLDLVCEKDCVMGFWALNGQTSLAYRILERYGFKVITSVTWLKLRQRGGLATIPNGGPAQNVSELFLIARRGKGLPISKTAERFKSVMAFPITVHSAKPPIFREMLAALYPKTHDGKRVKRLELFARNRAPGWNAWGNQAPTKVGAPPRKLKKAA